MITDGIGYRERACQVRAVISLVYNFADLEKN